MLGKMLPFMTGIARVAQGLMRNDGLAQLGRYHLNPSL